MVLASEFTFYGIYWIDRPTIELTHSSFRRLPHPQLFLLILRKSFDFS
jgi:hypothetical protein